MCEFNAMLFAKAQNKRAASYDTAVEILGRDCFTVLFVEPIVNRNFGEMIQRGANFNLQYLIGRTCIVGHNLVRLRNLRPGYEELAELFKLLRQGKENAIALCSKMISKHQFYGPFAGDIAKVLCTKYLSGISVTPGRHSVYGLRVAIGVNAPQLDIGLFATTQISAKALLPGFHAVCVPMALLKLAELCDDCLLPDLCVGAAPFGKARIGLGLGSYPEHACTYHYACFPGKYPETVVAQFPHYTANTEDSDYMDGEITTVRVVQAGESITIPYSDDCRYPCKQCSPSFDEVDSRKLFSNCSILQVFNADSTQLRPVAVLPSTRHGFGLFATEMIEADVRFCVYAGELVELSDAEADSFKDREYIIPVSEGRYINGRVVTRLPDANLVDYRTGLNIAGTFANSTSDFNEKEFANAEFMCVDGAVFLVSLRDILVDEEVLVDYHWLFNEHCYCEKCMDFETKMK